MRIVEVNSPSHPGLELFASLTEAQLRNRLEPEKGIFIAESPKVIGVALRAGYQPVALLCERRHLEGDAAPLLPHCGDIPIYIGEREVLATLTGYTLTRGVLCAMRRPAPRTLADICRDARRLAVVEGVVDAANVGAIFRSAAALGIDGVVVAQGSCDPLNRRAVRVSMGSVFLVPWAFAPAPAAPALRELGFQTAALALTPDALSLDDPRLRRIPRLALTLGAEGEGLPPESIRAADLVVRIPMSHGVDSLNVAAASAVAFWELRARV